MMNTSEIINHSGIEFGTSGARGLVSDFTHCVTAAYILAFLNHTRKEFSFDTVAIAIDNRPSSYRIAQYCASVVEFMGIKLVFYGVIPTPALAYKSMHDQIPAIMVTGSHIPFDRNGLKFYRPDGEISKQDEIEINNAQINFDPSELVLADLTVCTAASEFYIERYTKLLPDGFFAGLHIGIYEHSSAGRDLYATIFQRLGAKVTSFGRSDEFIPIDTEAVSQEDRARAREWAQFYTLDSIFSTDGDGDRPLIADENGCWLRGDILGLLCADELNIEGLAVPVSCNTAIELSGMFNEVQRTRIGSPHVIEAFSALNSRFERVAGFEANGGFLLGSNIHYGDASISALPTRDAVLPAIMLLAASKKSSISELVAKLPLRFTHSDRLKNFDRNRSLVLMSEALNNPDCFLEKIGLVGKVIDTNTIDGLRLTMDTGDIIHLRPSGNAPELRCYAESDASESAEYLVTQTLNALRAY